MKDFRSAASQERRRIDRERYLARNALKPCSISSCTKVRYNLSTYCRGHFQKYRRYAHPIDPAPPQADFKLLEEAIKVWLEEDLLTTEDAKRGFKLSWGSAQQTIRTSPSFALPFFRLEGNEGFTQKAKAWIILSHYFHKQKHSLSDTMLRYMAVRLWAEFNWQMPEGKLGATKERNFFVHTWAGYFVLKNSGFTKAKTEEKIIGWQRPWYIHEDPRQNHLIPITEKTIRNIGLTPFKAGPIVRAIGKEIHSAVDHAMGRKWCSDQRLLMRAYEALGLPNSNKPNSRACGQSS